MLGREPGPAWSPHSGSVNKLTLVNRPHRERALLREDLSKRGDSAACEAHKRSRLVLLRQEDGRNRRAMITALLALAIDSPSCSPSTDHLH